MPNITALRMKKNPKTPALKDGKTEAREGKESFKVRWEDLAEELIDYVMPTVAPSLVHHRRLLPTSVSGPW